jgi:hypothetical protein
MYDTIYLYDIKYINTFIVLLFSVDLSEIDWVDVDWIHLAQDKDQWRALVNTVMSLRIP